MLLDECPDWLLVDRLQEGLCLDSGDLRLWSLSLIFAVKVVALGQHAFFLDAEQRVKRVPTETIIVELLARSCWDFLRWNLYFTGSLGSEYLWLSMLRLELICHLKWLFLLLV